MINDECKLILARRQVHATYTDGHSRTYSCFMIAEQASHTGISESYNSIIIFRI